MPAKSQPRPSLADQLERLTLRFDELTQRARLGTRHDGVISPAEYDELEEEANALSRDLRAVFRGKAKPTAPILWRSPDGRGILV